MRENSAVVNIYPLVTQHSYGKSPFRVDFSIKTSDFPWLCQITRGYPVKILLGTPVIPCPLHPHLSCKASFYELSESCYLCRPRHVMSLLLRWQWFFGTLRQSNMVCWNIDHLYVIFLATKLHLVSGFSIAMFDYQRVTPIPRPLNFEVCGHVLHSLGINTTWQFGQQRLWFNTWPLRWTTHLLATVFGIESRFIWEKVSNIRKEEMYGAVDKGRC